MPILGCVMEKECEYCGHKIPKTRLDVLPTTTTCVKCSKERHNIGVISADEHGDGMDVQISKPDYAENDGNHKKKKHHVEDEE